MLNLKLKHSNATEVQSLLLAAMLFPIEILFINKKYTFLTNSDRYVSIAPTHVKIPFYQLNIKDICVKGCECKVLLSVIGVGTDSARRTDSCNWVLKSTVTDMHWW